MKSKNISSEVIEGRVCIWIPCKPGRQEAVRDDAIRAINEHAALVAVAEAAESLHGWFPANIKDMNINQLTAHNALENLAVVRNGKVAS